MSRYREFSTFIPLRPRSIVVEKMLRISWLCASKISSVLLRRIASFFLLLFLFSLTFLFRLPFQLPVEIPDFERKLTDVRALERKGKKNRLQVPANSSNINNNRLLKLRNPYTISQYNCKVQLRTVCERIHSFASQHLFSDLSRQHLLQSIPETASFSHSYSKCKKSYHYNVT